MTHRRTLVQHKLTIPSAAPDIPERAVTRRALAHFLERNQCPHCLGWSAGARRLAEQMAGQRGHMRPCSCTEPVAPTGQEPLDFGGAA
jgi:hypothetical protein